MTDLGDRLRGVLHDEGWALPAWPDPMARITAARRRRTRRRQQAFAACAVAAVIAVAASVVAAATQGGHPAAPTHPQPPTAPARHHSTAPSTPASNPGSGPAVTATCQPGWHVASEPFASGDRQHRLWAIGASSADDAWAVGERWADSPYGSGPRQVPYPLIEHWDGHAWTEVRVGNPKDLPGSLYGIAVISATDAWAVGGFQAMTAATRNAPLVEHWNGERWSMIPVPALANTGPHQEQALTAVTGISSNDVWALGNVSLNGAGYVNRLLRWDGQVWTRVAVPQPSLSGSSGGGSISLLTAIAIDPTTGSPWAVGGDLQGVSESFTLDGAWFGSWSGTNWVDRQPPPGTLPLEALSFSGTQVWAIRRPDLATSPDGIRWGRAGRSSVLRWNGSRWETAFTTPGRLSGLSAVTDRDIWAAGSRHGPLLVHWDGRSWTTVSDSPPVQVHDGVSAITGANDDTVLALGVSAAKPGSHIALWTRCPGASSAK